MDVLCTPIPPTVESEDSSSDEEWDDGTRKMTREEWIKYSKQVRESEGFDVDPLPYGVVAWGVIQPGKVFTDRPSDVDETARLAINHINSTEGRKLKLDRVIKFNTQPACPIILYITFTATDINTGGTHAYQAKVTETFPFEESSVDIFRRIYNQQFGKEDEIRFLTIFAINYYSRTMGQDLELVRGIVYDQRNDSYIITFKARDLSSCMVEIYQTEVVSRDPIENSTVNVFIKNPDPSTYQDLVPVANTSESSVASARRAWANLGKDGAIPFNHRKGSALEYAKMSGARSMTSCKEYG